MEDNVEIRPFRIEIPQADVDELRERVARTRWPYEPPEQGWGRGIPSAYLRGLADRWLTVFDWRAQEARLNEMPQFVTGIDGQRVHFAHVRSPEPGALPLLITHGYPGSFAEFRDIAGPLSDPRSHGGDPADAFHVVAPSIPGFAFSTPVREAGWDVARTSRAFAELMRRLGYDRYGAQGGDVGSAVSGTLGAIDAGHVVGIHLNSDLLGAAWLAGDPVPVDMGTLTEEERGRLDALKAVTAEGKGYLQIQTTRPQAVAFALTDSPVGQLAWIAEKFKEWTDPAAELPEDAVDVDLLLAIVSLYWFTRSGASAAHFLYETAHTRDWGSPAVVPQGWAMFGGRDEIIRKLYDPKHELAHWTEYDRGGHFAAMEAPDLLVEDVRTFFRPLR
ncbi:epoxide hydrolase family protein [Bailinhaonella thermotolerans]|uniref:Epoxide hydrolase n=1 Tax=Bailinhaonella thermotolerans TaxID=1070861 RepID=A0A3A4ADQ5_9ACTN|nr:epoxide hydrolase family protein [Bailinhaonella thermotolerans]RJL24804.1 epoxide hydrolase [Bailinhaonella thermotolerans]